MNNITVDQFQGGRIAGSEYYAHDSITRTGAYGKTPDAALESLYKILDRNKQRKLSRDTAKGLAVASASILVGCAMVIYFAVYPIAEVAK